MFTELVAPELPGRRARLWIVNELRRDADDFGLQLFDKLLGAPRPSRRVVVGYANRLDLNFGLVHRSHVTGESLQPVYQAVGCVDANRWKLLRIFCLCRGVGEIRIAEGCRKPQGDPRIVEAGPTEILADDRQVACQDSRLALRDRLDENGL